MDYSMTSILDVAKQFITQLVPRAGVAVDFTMGNGHDTFFLSQWLEEGHVYAFDIQEEAVKSTRKHLKEWGARENYTLIHACHSRMKEFVTGPIDGGMFNLGYLPHSDKAVTTRHKTSLAAIQTATEMLKPGGVLVVAVYPGHGEGALEGELVQRLAAGLDSRRFDSFFYRLLNQPSAPFLVAIQRKK